MRNKQLVIYIKDSLNDVPSCFAFDELDIPIAFTLNHQMTDPVVVTPPRRATHSE